MAVVSSTRQYAKLVGALRHFEGSSILVVAVIDDQVIEDELESSLAAELASEFSFRFWPIDPVVPSVAQFLWREPIESPATVLVVDGWRDLPTEKMEWAISRLNQERDILLRAGCVIVFVVTSEIFDLIVREAPDFWTRISGPYEFQSPGPGIKQRVRDDLKSHYLAYLRERQGELDFRGVLTIHQVSPLPLCGLFVRPLVTREDSTGASEEGSSGNERWPTDKVEIDFASLLQGRLRSVILGAPGCGKTTLLRYIALSLAADVDCTRRELGIDTLSQPMWLPVLFPVCVYARAMQDDPDLSLVDCLLQYFLALLGRDLTPLLVYELERGNCLLLFDGLDEIVGSSERWSVVMRLRDFVQKYPNNRLLLTCRSDNYDPSYFGNDFRHIELTQLSDVIIEKFVNRWFEVSAKLGTLSVERTPAELLRVIRQNPEVHDLARTPLLLAIIILVYYFRGVNVPYRSVDLYRECVEALAESWIWARSISDDTSKRQQLKFDRNYVMAVLSPVAFWLCELGLDMFVSRTEVEEKVALWQRVYYGSTLIQSQEIARGFIQLMIEQSGLLVQRGVDNLAFPHQSFKEFLAADYIASHDTEKLVCERMDNSQWYEVIRLTAAQLKAKRLQDLISAMLRTANGENKSNQIILIGECVRDATQGALPFEVKNQITYGIQLVLADSAESFGTRRRAADVLGDLGDPRPGEVVKIPAGKLIMGLSDSDFQSILAQVAGRLDVSRMLALALPQQRMQIAAFGIDRYLVTNGQYLQFIDDYGYDKLEFWSDEGWRWRQRNEPRPAWWDDEDLGIRKLNHPVLGISLYEAEAFCKWRSASEQQKTGKVCRYRLPTESEWERAARGDDERWWPWGKEWQEDHANVDKTIFKTTPVGIYPAGSSPFGILDMAGNVHEWTKDHFKLYNERYSRDRDQMSVRGGSFNSGRWWAMCTTRQSVSCDQRQGATGFRCVLELQDGD